MVDKSVVGNVNDSKSNALSIILCLPLFFLNSIVYSLMHLLALNSFVGFLNNDYLNIANYVGVLAVVALMYCVIFIKNFFLDNSKTLSDKEKLVINVLRNVIGFCGILYVYYEMGLKEVIADKFNATFFVLSVFLVLLILELILSKFSIKLKVRNRLIKK